MARGVAAFGGTFDPVHNGHMIIARSILEQLQLDRVLFVPAAQPPHKEDRSISPFDQRLAMVELAVAREQGLGVSSIESTLPVPNYTLNTVRALTDSLGPDIQLHWIIGADSLAELDTWYRVAELIEACRVVTARRPGWDAPDLTHLLEVLTTPQLERVRAAIVETPRIDISSTDIRTRVAAGRSIRYLVPDAVREFIARTNLYG